MLFLVNHVKSKSYVAEASGIEELTQDWESQESESDVKLKVEQLETCLVAVNSNEENSQVMMYTTGNSSQALSYAVDENDEFVECYAAEEQDEQEDTFDDDYYEEEETLESDETNTDQQITSNDDVMVEDIPEEQWIKNTTQDNFISRKRRSSFDPQDEPPAKKEFIKPESPAPETSDAPDDEDAVFGRTIGLMLKKIPQHLKTAVKLKIFQSLAEFEIEHKLNEPK